jgi:DNA-binding NarL/FixJ family response regulator
MHRTVLVADEELIVREGLISFLRNHHVIQEIDEAISCSQIMSFLKTKKYSHLITEVELRDGSTASILPTIRELYSDMRILVFSTLREDLIIQPLLAYNINYYLHKKSSKEKMTKEFQQFFSSEIPIQPLKKLAKGDKLLDLSPRQFEVLTLMMKDKSNKEIASDLNLAPNTISTIKQRIFEKNNVQNFQQLKDLARFYKPKKRKS